MSKEKLDASLRLLYAKLSAAGAKSADELEDYINDVVVQLMVHGRDVRQWLGYIYKAVVKRIQYKREHRNLDALSLDAITNVADGGLPFTVKADIHRAIAKLNPNQQELVYKYFFEGYTLQELADMRGCRAVTIYQTLGRALANLRRELEPPQPTR